MKLFWYKLNVILVIVSCYFATLSFAQKDYPNKPIRLIVPYAAGGSTTITSRMVGQQLTDAWGQQVIIDNRPGGNTIIGTQAGVRARPDGYTLLYIGSALSGNHTLTKTPYDATKDIAGIATVSSYENLLVVPLSLPVNTLQDLVALAKSKPGQINYASSSSGGSTHLSPELFNSVAGIKTQQIPYKGSIPALTDLIGGQVHFMMSPPSNVVGYVKSNRIKALAVSGEQRMIALPQVPTFAEAGVPGVSLKSWQGIGVPNGVPRIIIDKISDEISKLVAHPDTKDKMELQGSVPFYNNALQTTALIKADIIKHAKIIKDANIKLE